MRKAETFRYCDGRTKAEMRENAHIALDMLFDGKLRKGDAVLFEIDEDGFPEYALVREIEDGSSKEKES